MHEQIGYNCVLEKAKDIRYKFFVLANGEVKVAGSGIGGGSGRIVLEYFHFLKIIFWGAPATLKIPSCINISSVNSNLVQFSLAKVLA